MGKVRACFVCGAIELTCLSGHLTMPATYALLASKDLANLCITFQGGFPLGLQVLPSFKVVGMPSCGVSHGSKKDSCAPRSGRLWQHFRPVLTLHRVISHRPIGPAFCQVPSCQPGPGAVSCGSTTCPHSIPAWSGLNSLDDLRNRGIQRGTKPSWHQARPRARRGRNRKV
jgi:hypothetical protein